MVLAAIVAGLFLGGEQPETAAPSITVDITGNPAVVADDEPQEAETEPPVPAPPDVAATPQELLIGEAIRQRLGDAVLRKGHHADDLAAVDGFYKAHSGPALWLDSSGISRKGQSVLGALGKAEDWGLDPTLFRVPPGDYQPAAEADQAATEIAITLAALRYARAAQGGLDDPNTISKIYGLSPTVRAPQTVLTELAGADAPDAYLTDLHPKHEQFERLRQALPKAQNEEEDIRIRSNMDRWRWMPETPKGTYVWLNIPEFKLHVVEDGKTVQSENVMVGGRNTPTPVLSADMTEIVFNPERVVPLSLIRKDVLPKLQGGGGLFGRNDTSILDQYRITVKRRGKPVDPSTIDWKTVNLSTLTFVQAPGRTNILKVKFLYPNDRGIYLHDAVTASQLARAVRAEGQKEPRLGSADKVAAALLAKSNGMSAAKVNQLAGGGATNRVKLDTAIPVHMTYFTAVVDEQGNLQTFDDVYKLDGRGAPDDAASLSPAPSSASGAEPAPRPVRKPANGSLAATAR